jgi:26S proteasome regulatory subunit T6
MKWEMNMQSRFDIVKIHSRRMNLMRGIDMKKIAEKMNGASGAELKVFFSLYQFLLYLLLLLF